MDVEENIFKGASTMKKGVKEFIKKYVLPVIAGVLFVTYGVCELKINNEVGAILGFGATILLVVSFIYNLKVDREDKEKRQELEAKAPQVSDDLPEKVRAMKAQNQDIQAIKLVREQTGMSLYDAKNYVDSIDA